MVYIIKVASGDVKDVKNKIDIIAGIAVNISTGYTYYDMNGKFINKKDKFNIYNHGDIEVYPSEVDIVLTVCIEKKALLDAIEIKKFNNRVRLKSRYKKYITASTHLIVQKTGNDPYYADIWIESDKIMKHGKRSLTAILVVDNDNNLSWPHGTYKMNWPTTLDYNNHIFHKQPVTWDPKSGIDKEIFIHFNINFKKRFCYRCLSFNAIFTIEAKKINILRSLKKNTTGNHFRKAHDELTKKQSCEPFDPSKKYNCYLTGVPLFEDVYYVMNSSTKNGYLLSPIALHYLSAINLILNHCDWSSVYRTYINRTRTEVISSMNITEEHKYVLNNLSLIKIPENTPYGVIGYSTNNKIVLHKYVPNYINSRGSNTIDVLVDEY